VITACFAVLDRGDISILITSSMDLVSSPVAHFLVLNLLKKKKKDHVCHKTVIKSNIVKCHPIFHLCS
jgi:hypothetical protein